MPLIVASYLQLRPVTLDRQGHHQTLFYIAPESLTSSDFHYPTDPYSSIQYPLRIGFRAPDPNFRQWIPSKAEMVVPVTIDVHAAKDLVDSGHYFLDVRTVEEFKNGYPGAEKVLNIPYLFSTRQGRVKNPQFLEQFTAAYGLEDQIVVGCRSGIRSLDATVDLLKVGYKNVCNMGGGYLAWVEEDLPVKKPLEPEPEPKLNHRT